MTQKELIIDWDLSIQLCNNNKDIAKELLDIFLKELPDYHTQLKQAYSNKDYQTLGNITHKLHGACCYIGAPQLKNEIQSFENLLKSGDTANINEPFMSISTLLDAAYQELQTREFNGQH